MGISTNIIEKTNLIWTIADKLTGVYKMKKCRALQNQMINPYADIFTIQNSKMLQ